MYFHNFYSKTSNLDRMLKCLFFVFKTLGMPKLEWF